VSTDRSIDTDPRLIDSVCDSLGFPVDLAHLVPIVFSACDGLGAAHAPVMRLLHIAGVSSRTKLIDLACGKGDLSRMIVDRFGAHVTGIDACGALLREARKNAQHATSRRRLRFRRADITSLRSSKHHVAMMIGLLGAEHAPSILRRHVMKGGYYVFDDALPHTTRIEAREFVQRSVGANGDELCAWAFVNPASFRKMTVRNQTDIRTGIDAAITIAPRDATRLRRWFASFQRHAARIADDHIVGYWLVRKST